MEEVDGSCADGVWGDEVVSVSIFVRGGECGMD